jgi:hypothetical protein
MSRLLINGRAQSVTSLLSYEDGKGDLYIPSGQANSTMLIITPIPQDVLGESFQRQTWLPEGEDKYVRRLYSPRALKSKLLDYGARLAVTPEEGKHLYLDVAKSMKPA